VCRPSDLCAIPRGVFATRRNVQGKFEWQFKYRDESNLNAARPWICRYRSNADGIAVSCAGDASVTVPFGASLTKSAQPFSAPAD
jgi:hypothetical protein